MLVRWYAPFLADSGFGSEATSFVESLQQMLWPVVHAVNFAEPAQFPPPSSIASAFYPKSTPTCIISICHSTPNFWATPQSDYPSWDRAARCPPLDTDVKIGRSMFETNSLPEDWKWRLDYMDYIWVPTDFAKQVYLNAGVDGKKLVVVPEPINTEMYSNKHCGSTTTREKKFVFLSIFKWEERKAWRSLLEAFLTEFARDEQVMLRIKTSSFHMQQQSPQHVAKLAFPLMLLSRAEIRFDVDKRVSEQELVDDFYCKADAFVLPSMGEGWGRPHAEAASMGLPVIYTNFSGPTEFLNSSIAFPVGYDLVDVQNLPGHQWAMPRQQDLRQAMRKVFTMSREERNALGAKASAHMHSMYSQQAIGELLKQVLAPLCSEKRSKLEL